MKINRLPPFVCLMLLIGPPAQGISDVDSQEVVVPSLTCGDYFLIPLEIDLDSDGQSTTLTAIFDTGGSSFHVDPDAVVRAGGKVVQGRQRVTLRNLTAGPLTIRKIRPNLRQLDHLSQALGIEVDLFLPFRTFKNYLLTLDFPKQEIRIARGRLPPPDDKTIFDARGPDRRPYLEVSIAGHDHRLLVDSGASGSISIHENREFSWVSPLVPASVGQGMTKLFFSDIGRLDATVEIAGVGIRQPLVRIVADTELIGSKIMRPFAWTFDQKSRRLRITPASPEPLLMSPKRGTGAIVIPHEAGYEVVKVLPNTPAEREGLLIGDIIVAADGVRILEQDCGRWDEQYLAETMLTVLRDSEVIDHTIEIIDIVP